MWKKNSERYENDQSEKLRRIYKKIRHLLTDIHEESVSGKAESGVPLLRTLARFSSLLGVLSIRADIQTRRLVRLTWALVFLTVALLGFTAYLSYEAYLN